MHIFSIGDNFYKKFFEEAEKDHRTMLMESDFKTKKNETLEEREQRLDKFADYMYEYYKGAHRNSLLKTNPPRIMKNGTTKEIWAEGAMEMTIQNPDGTTLVTFDKSSTTYQWIFTEPYRDKIALPYVLVDLGVLAESCHLKE